MKRHLLLGGIAIAITFAATITNVSPTLLVQQQPLLPLLQAEAFTNTWSGCRKAPVVISGDNVYIAWWSNKTGNNDEGMFRASTDGGQTFDEKINLSNTTTTDSVDAEIAAEGGKVIVTWWE
jgi:hypothetical protein